MKARNVWLEFATQVPANKLIRVGSRVDTRFGEAEVEHIELVSPGETKYGVAVDSAPWSDKDSYVFDLSNGHFVYGFQIYDVLSESLKHEQHVWTREEQAELANLYHLARTALAPGDPSEYERRLWASKEFSKLYPEVSSTAAYSELERQSAWRY